ncbi:MAG TPA: hypothetical protein VGO00_17175, partial [Kofleriaceae bacterium]|nr:hypothetical protein [Kofleriaceae bacterium]
MLPAYSPGSRSCPKRLAKIVLEQVDVGVESEAGRVVAEPALHLHDIPPLHEQARRDGVAKPMEARTLDTGRLTRRREHSHGQIVRVEDRAGGRGEHEVIGSGIEGAEAISESAWYRHVALGIAGLERADHKTLSAAATHTLAHLDMRPLTVEREMTAFEHEQLRAPQTRRREQLEHESMRFVDVLDNQLHRLDRLAVIALDARKGPWPVIVVIHRCPVRQRDIGRRVVTNQPLSTGRRQTRLER